MHGAQHEPAMQYRRKCHGTLQCWGLLALAITCCQPWVVAQPQQELDAYSGMSTCLLRGLQAEAIRCENSRLVTAAGEPSLHTVIQLLNNCNIISINSSLTDGQSAGEHFDVLLPPAAGNRFVALLQPALDIYSHMANIEASIVAAGSQAEFSARLYNSLIDPSNKTGQIELWMASAAEAGAAIQSDALMLMTNEAQQDNGLQISTLLPVLTSQALLWADQIVSLPLTWLTPYVFYREDVFTANGWVIPLTWNALIAFIQQVNGTQDMWAFGAAWDCDELRTFLFRSIFSSMTQAHGVDDGWLIDSDTMEPLLDSPALTETMHTLQQLHALSAPDLSLQHEQPCSPQSRSFEQGKALMTISLPSTFKGQLGVANLPGSGMVLDRANNNLTLCTAATCPFGTVRIKNGVMSIVNRSPPLDALVWYINGRATVMERHAAYSWASYMASRRITDYLTYDPQLPMYGVRTAHLLPGIWRQFGYDFDDAKQLCTAGAWVVQHANLNFQVRFAASQGLTDLQATLALNATSRQSALSVAEASELRQYSQSLAVQIISEAFHGNWTEATRQYRESIYFVASPDDSQSSSGDLGGPPLKEMQLKVIAPVSVVTFVLLVVVSVIIYKARSQVMAPYIRTCKHPGPSTETTLIVTDIENSTPLWETLQPDVLDYAMRLHNHCIRDLVAQHNGYESAWEGDSFILAFDTPLAATICALQIQQELMKLDWPAALLASEYACPIWLQPTKPSTFVQNSAGGWQHRCHSHKQLQRNMSGSSLEQPASSSAPGITLIPVAISSSQPNSPSHAPPHGSIPHPHPVRSPAMIGPPRLQCSYTSSGFTTAKSRCFTDSVLFDSAPAAYGRSRLGPSMSRTSSMDIDCGTSSTTAVTDTSQQVRHASASIIEDAAYDVIQAAGPISTRSAEHQCEGYIDAVTPLSNPHRHDGALDVLHNQEQLHPHAASVQAGSQSGQACMRHQAPLQVQPDTSMPSQQSSKPELNIAASQPSATTKRLLARGASRKAVLFGDEAGGVLSTTQLDDDLLQALQACVGDDVHACNRKGEGEEEQGWQGDEDWEATLEHSQLHSCGGDTSDSTSATAAEGHPAVGFETSEDAVAYDGTAECAVYAQVLDSSWVACKEQAIGAVLAFTGLRVRIGMHAGVVNESDINYNNVMGRYHYSGPGRVIANALASASHGGQILVSKKTLATPEGALLAWHHKGLITHLPTDCACFNMGRHVLADAGREPMDLVCMLPRSLTCRMVLKDRHALRKSQILLPGFLKAPVPGSAPVFIACIQLHGLCTLFAWDQAETSAALALAHASLLQACAQWQGVVSEDGISIAGITSGGNATPPESSIGKPGCMVVVFTSARAALGWAMQVRNHLLWLSWSEALLSHSLCEHVGGSLAALTDLPDATSCWHPVKTKGSRYDAHSAGRMSSDPFEVPSVRTALAAGPSTATELNSGMGYGILNPLAYKTDPHRASEPCMLWADRPSLSNSSRPARARPVLDLVHQRRSMDDRACRSATGWTQLSVGVPWTEVDVHSQGRRRKASCDFQLATSHTGDAASVNGSDGTMGSTCSTPVHDVSPAVPASTTPAATVRGDGRTKEHTASAGTVTHKWDKWARGLAHRVKGSSKSMFVHDAPALRGLRAHVAVVASGKSCAAAVGLVGRVTYTGPCMKRLQKMLETATPGQVISTSDVLKSAST